MTTVITNETAMRILSRSLFNSNSAQPMELIISENIAHPRKLKKYLSPAAVDVSSSRFTLITSVRTASAFRTFSKSKAPVASFAEGYTLIG